MQILYHDKDAGRPGESFHLVDNPSAGFYTSARTGMLPGGQGLEAVGSYDGSGARGLRVLQLTPIQIQNPLQKKMVTKIK